MIGVRDGQLEEHEVLDPKRCIWRVDLRTKNWSKNILVQTLKYVEWSVRIIMRLRANRPDVIQCHSFSALPVSVLAKYFTKSRLVYDAHELETEKNGMRGVEKILARILEKRLIRHADEMIVVSESIAEWYEKSIGGKRPVVIKNVPKKIKMVSAAGPNLRKTLGIQEDFVLYIYQGALVPGRGIEKLLSVFSRANPQRHLAIMGYGPLKTTAIEYQQKFSNIHYHEAVLPEDVVRYVSSADVGIYLIENTCLSYYYCLPNKIFESLMSGLPVVVSDLPELRNVVRTYDCGWIAPQGDDQLIDLINKINKADISEKRHNAYKVQEEHNWEHEEVKLISMYRSLGRS